jgi:hypothetical protein
MVVTPSPSEAKWTLGLGKLLNLSYVPRWVIVPMMRAQSVAEHSWRVAVIASELAARLGLGADKQLVIIQMAVYHDYEEVLTGDVPSTEKPYPKFESMSNSELVVKLADYIEALTWVKLWAHSRAHGEVEDYLWPKYQEAAGVLSSRINMGVVDIVEDLRTRILRGE